MGHGAWGMEHGAWSRGHGAGGMEQGAWSRGQGAAREVTAPAESPVTLR